MIRSFFRKEFSFLLTLFGSLFLIADLHANETTHQNAAKFLGISEVTESIRHHYPLVISALRELDRADADFMAARGAFDPLLRSSYSVTPEGEYRNRNADVSIEQPTRVWGAKLLGGYRVGAGRFGPYDERLATLDRGEFRGGVEIPFLRGGSIDERRARLKVTELGVEGAQFALKSHEIDAVRAGTHRFWDWVSAGKKLVINDELRKLASDRDQAMRHRVRMGDAAQVEQVDNARSLYQRDAALVSAQRSFQKAQLELSIFFRDSGGEPVTAPIERVPEQFDNRMNSVLSKIELIRKDLLSIVEQHPDVERMKRQVSQFDTEVSLSDNLVLPRLDSDFLISKDTGVGSASKQQTEYKLALRLEFPLFFRTPRGRLASAVANQNRSEALLTLARNRAKVALDDSIQAIEVSARRIEFSAQEVVAAKKVEDAEKIKFKHGDSNILTVNLREQATADARIREVDANIDFWKAVADFKMALGNRSAALE